MKNYLMWTALFETRFFWKIVAQFFRFLWKASSRRHYPGSSWWDLWKIFQTSVDSEALERRAEAILQSEDLQKVIFGFSHLSNYRQFRNGKEYFNTGSWTRSLSLDMRRLGSTHKLHYVLIEFRDEPQAKLMEWQGKYEPVAEFL
jgi:UDP-2,3-diacylglucosamine pyrophosphatase LpxH